MVQTKEQKVLRRDVMNQISLLLTSAFALVAALAWNDAIKAGFSELFGTQTAVYAMIIYAVVVTIIAVVLIIMFARSGFKAKDIDD